MHEQLSLLGLRLREQRIERGLTLRELAAKTGLSAGLLSKIENFRTIPSLPVLVSIARALRMDMSALFSGIAASEKRPWLLMRSGCGAAVERESSSGFRYELLFESGLDASELQVMLVRVASDARRAAVSGGGTELIYMISGELDYRVGEDSIQLDSGDALLFDGALPHVPFNRSGNEAVMLVCYFLGEEKSDSRSGK